MQNHPELNWKPPAVKATLWHKTTLEQPNVIASSRPAGQLNNRASPLVSDRPNDPTPKLINRNVWSVFVSHWLAATIISRGTL